MFITNEPSPYAPPRSIDHETNPLEIASAVSAWFVCLSFATGVISPVALLVLFGLAIRGRLSNVTGEVLLPTLLSIIVIALIARIYVYFRVRTPVVLISLRSSFFFGFVAAVMTFVTLFTLGSLRIETPSLLWVVAIVAPFLLSMEWMCRRQKSLLAMSPYEVSLNENTPTRFVAIDEENTETAFCSLCSREVVIDSDERCTICKWPI